MLTGPTTIARQYSVCISLYILLSGIKASSFPGTDQINALIDRGRIIETIRTSILTKIGRRPPTDLHPKPVNKTFPEIPTKAENMYICEEEDIIAFSEPIENLKRDNIFKFSLTKDNRTLEIQSASVLVQVKFKRKLKKSRRTTKEKPRRIKLILSTVDDHGRIIQQISQKKARISRTNWFKLFLPKSLIQKALLSDNTSIKLHIRCKGCKRFARLVLLHGAKRKRKSKKGKKRRQGLRSRSIRKKRKLNRLRPFLLIHTKVKIRSRRETYRCQDTKNQCCKVPLVFSFEEVGWSDWVISPLSFNTNVCSGGCNSGSNWNRDYNFTYHCTERKHKPLRIMYFDRTGAVITSELPKLIVTECGCS